MNSSGAARRFNIAGVEWRDGVAMAAGERGSPHAPRCCFVFYEVG